MRLKNIYETLKLVQPTINLIKTEKVNKNNNEYDIQNWAAFLHSLEKLEQIDFFQNVAESLFNYSPIFGQKKDTIRIPSSLYSNFVNWFSKLKDNISIIIELCESLGYKEDESSFEVKLPETNDFDEFITNINELKQVIQLCPFIKADDSEISFVKTDIGSTWFAFIITGNVVALLSALGYVAKSALKIKSMYLTCEQQKEEVRAAQTKNELAEELTNMYKQLIKVTAENEVRSLEEKLNLNLEPEDRISAEKSIKKLGDLMSKGLEIYAALDSPPEARDVFPTVKEQKTLPSNPRLLSEKTDTD